VVSRWSVSLYGFAELDAIHDSLQGPNDLMGNAALPRSGTYAATHDQATFSVRNSRLGLRVGAPDLGPIRASAVAEMDFFGNQPPVSEAAFFNNPTFGSGTYFKAEGRRPHHRPEGVVRLQAYFIRRANLQGFLTGLSGRGRSDLRHRAPSDVELSALARSGAQRSGALPDGQADSRISGRKAHRTLGGAKRAGCHGSGVSGRSASRCPPSNQTPRLTSLPTAGASVNLL
jgi:hypothetical protein